MITEAEKSHNLPYASLKYKKAGCIIHSEKGLGSGGADGVNLSLRAEDEMRCPCSSNEAEKNGQIPPSFAFCLIQAFSFMDEARPQR